MLLVSRLSPQRVNFDPGSVSLEFVVDKVALEKVFLRVRYFFLSVSLHQCSILLHSFTCCSHLKEKRVRAENFAETMIFLKSVNTEYKRILTCL
jgi:hypothetical protein